MSKTHIKNDLKKVYLVLEGEEHWQEDYQVAMLQENNIPKILKMEVRYLNNCIQYYYDISGKTSFEKYYENAKLTREDMQKLVEDLLLAIQTLQKYMLNGNGLLLEPGMIFRDKEGFHFCYHPKNEKDARIEFHKLTEVFVKEIDYKDEEGVRMAYTLHKSTMEENYNIEEIMLELAPKQEEDSEVDYIMETQKEEKDEVRENPLHKIWNWAKRRCLEDEYEDL